MGLLNVDAKIYKVNINPCVDIPLEIGRLLKPKGSIPVKVTFNAISFRSTLIPVKEKPYLLYINTEMRKQTQAEIGDIIHITLELDEESRELVPLPSFSEALQKNPKAKANWDELPPSHRKEYLVYLNSLKSQEAVERNIERIIKKLLRD
jgi:hypothetical protein